ncbi:MAG TPA: hypothetical protein VFG37_03185 [Planctomycetota bacterium]|jgi:hypothetical protein|nr:hypothetical protein [Planctomycetota bacterium]
MNEVLTATTSDARGSGDGNGRDAFTAIVQRVLIAAFLGAIGLPALGLALHLDRGGSSGENRRLAPPPELADLLRPGHFLYTFKQYVQDNFGFRSRLVRWHSLVTLGLLRSSPSTNVVLGKERWLFQANEHVLEDYQCVRPYTDLELGRWTEAFERRRAWLEERGIRYLVVFAPNTSTIYPEQLPDRLRRLGPKSRMDQLCEALRATTPVRALDLRPALLAAKARERLYHTTDTHWNDRGAFVAYTEIVAALTPWFPAERPLPRDAFDAVAQDAIGGDLAGQIGLADEYREEWLRLVPRAPRRAVFTPSLEEQQRHFKVISDMEHVAEVRDGASGLPRAVMFRDSFGTALLPFLAEHFARIRFDWVDERFDAGVVESEQPQLVIQEVTERFLMRDPPKAFVGRP